MTARIAWYTLAPKGSALAMGLKIPDADRQDVARVGVKLAGALPKRMTPARQKVVEIAQDGAVRLKSELAHAAGVSNGVVDGLIDEGTLETIALLAEPVAEMPDPAFNHTA